MLSENSSLERYANFSSNQGLCFRFGIGLGVSLGEGLGVGLGIALGLDLGIGLFLLP